MLIKEQAGGKMKTLDLVKEYGGIDQLIEDVENTFTGRDIEVLFEAGFIETILYALKDYKVMIEKNKRLKRKIEKTEYKRAWPVPESMKIGDRHEMGG